MKHLPIIFSALLFTVLLCGCTDSTELGNRAIIQAAAIDYDGGYKVSAMLFSSGGTGGDTVDPAEENVIRVTGEGETLSAAIDNISLIDGKRIYMSETKLLILGGGFERASAAQALRTLYFDMRCSLNLPVCCSYNASEIIGLQFSEGLTAAEKPLALIENANAMGVSPKTTLLDLLADDAGGRESVLPRLEIIENGSGVTKDDSGKTAVINGSGVFSDGRLGKTLDCGQTAAKMLLDGKSRKIILNYTLGDSERTCEAYCVKISEDSDNKNMKRVTAKFRTRVGGALSKEERKAALSSLTDLISYGLKYAEE